MNFNEYQEIKYGSIKQEIDILNAANIIPGRVSQLSYAQKHPSMIRYLFPDLITQYGWRFYALNTFIDLGYGDYKHKLLKFCFSFFYWSLLRSFSANEDMIKRKWKRGILNPRTYFFFTGVLCFPRITDFVSF